MLEKHGFGKFGPTFLSIVHMKISFIGLMKKAA